MTYDDRFQTMSLGTNGDCKITESLKGRRAHLQVPTVTNNVGGIDGCRPEIKANRYLNRPDLSIAVGDIKGTASRRLHPADPHKVIGLNLTNDDIELSKPRAYTFKTGRENDPLNPAYKVPSCKVENAPTPKFMRETNQLTDIGGTSSKPLYRYEMRNNHVVDDIEGAQVGWRPRHQRRGPERDIINVQDINLSGYKSNRVTDPLNPVHYVNGMEISDDPASKPKTLPPARDGGWAPTLSLTTQDIEGAVPGWKPKHVNGGIPEEHRRHFRNTNYIGDIAGTQADSLAHGIRTMRVSDPMAPTYASLDGAPLLDSARLPDYPDDNAQRFMRSTQMASRGQTIVSARGGTPGSARGYGPGPGTPMSQRSAYGLSEKDRIIQQLTAEVGQLKRETYSGYSGGSGRGGGGSRAGLTSRSRDPTPRSQPASRGGDGYVSSTPPQRMVLQSRDGQPRVPSTPSERREARQLQSDIASVRDL
jgi:hypothetical protein